MPDSIQRVELSSYEIPLHCPFCGRRVLSYPEDEREAATTPEDMVTPCPHTLFVAHDEGFEYRSARFEQAMGLSADEDLLTADLGDDSYDSFTDKVPIRDSIKIASYVPAPSGFGTYVGFAPLESE